MKKKACMIALLALLTAGSIFTSCSKDDPVVPELDKLTKVTCYKNSITTPYFTADIVYKNTSIDRIIYSDEHERATYICRYSGSTGTVDRIDASGVLTPCREFVLSGGKISREECLAMNGYETYAAEIFTYRSNGIVSYTKRWPTESGYDERTTEKAYEYTWKNRNITKIAQFKTDVDIVYEYGLDLQLSNFPLRPQLELDPTNFKFVSPMNTFYMNNNRNLPIRAYSYTIPDVNNHLAEYTFTYKKTGEYITSMTVVDEVTGDTYRYSFEYNLKK